MQTPLVGSPSGVETLTPPAPWMRWVLWGAAAYNLLWGTWVVLFPRAFFQWLDLPEPNYLQLWQCIGMIIGVYGIGYAIAARDPFRHWPIVLVGLLGKVFGPLGFLNALAAGTLPWRFGATLLTNDLIWWWPFGAILFAAARAHQAGPLPQGAAGRSFAEVLRELRSQHGHSLEELSARQPVLVLFLRHGGCTFCREALSDLQKQRPALERRGLALAIVHMGDDHEAAARFARYRLDDVDRFSDPKRRLYQAFELPLGTFRQLLGLRVWVRGFIVALVRRHGFGRIEGNGFQMPGTFVLHRGTIIAAHRHRVASERIDFENFACTLKPEQAPTPERMEANV